MIGQYLIYHRSITMYTAYHWSFVFYDVIFYWTLYAVSMATLIQYGFHPFFVKHNFFSANVYSVYLHYKEKYNLLDELNLNFRMCTQYTYIIHLEF